MLLLRKNTPSPSIPGSLTPKTATIGVTNEGPRKGPLKGLVLVGRGPKPGRGPESVYEQGFAIGELQKLSQAQIDEVPDSWLEALGYDWPRPAPPVEEIRVNFLPEVFEPKRVRQSEPRYWPFVWGTILFIVAVVIFRWLKG